jgi:hypothetical protein
MTSKRVYYLMLGLIGLLFVGLLAGAYGANSLLAKQAVSLTALKAKSNALDKEQTSLVLAKKQVAKYAQLNKIVTSIVPQDKDQAEAVREIVGIADANQVALGSITFPASTLGNATTPVPVTAGGAAPTKPFASSPSASKTGALSQLQPVKNIPGVYDLQITVQGDSKNPITYSQLIAFLSSLENNRRTAQVSTISFEPVASTSNSGGSSVAYNSSSPASISFSLTLDEYIKPASTTK